MAPWTVAHQAPLPWNFPGKNTGVGCHSLLQSIFQLRERTRVSCDSCLGRWILHYYSYLGRPKFYVIYLVYLFWLCWVFAVVLSLSLVTSGGYFWLQCLSFSLRSCCCGAQALGTQASAVAMCRLWRVQASAVAMCRL